MKERWSVTYFIFIYQLAEVERFDERIHDIK